MANGWQLTANLLLFHFFLMIGSNEEIEGNEGKEFADKNDDAHGEGRGISCNSHDRHKDTAQEHIAESEEGRSASGILTAFR